MTRKRIIQGVSKSPILPPAVARQDFFEQSITKKYVLGTRYELFDGRVFRYARAGATALAAGELQQSAAFGGSAATVQADLTPSAAAIGATSVFITTVTDATTINQFADGYLAVSDGGAAIGQGEMYKITANAAGAAGLLRFDLDRPLTIAWTSSTRVSIMTNPYNLCVVTPTTPSGLVLGAAMGTVDINYYCWLQTWGMACVLNKTAALMGTSMILDVAAAGSIGVQTAGAASLTQPQIGISGLVTATTDSGLVFLTISP